MEFPSIFTRRVSLCFLIELRTRETSEVQQELNFSIAQCSTERMLKIVACLLGHLFTPGVESKLRKQLRKFYPPMCIPHESDLLYGVFPIACEY